MDIRFPAEMKIKINNYNISFSVELLKRRNFTQVNKF